MDEVNKPVETNVQDAGTEQAVETTQSAATEEKGVENAQSAPTEEIDYAAELKDALDAKEKAEKDRDNYKYALLKSKGKIKDTIVEQENIDANEDQVDLIADKVARKILPVIQSSTQNETIETILNEISSNPQEKELIKFHFENSVGSFGNLRERLENAKLIANKKSILKKERELKVALKNKSQISNKPQSSSSDVADIKPEYLSKDQMADLKKRGWDDKKIAMFIENLRKAKK